MTSASGARNSAAAGRSDLGQHDAHLIPEGLPDAGNLLVFDNQGEAGFPPVPLAVTGGREFLEIDPIKQEIGLGIYG